VRNSNGCERGDAEGGLDLTAGEKEKLVRWPDGVGYLFSQKRKLGEIPDMPDSTICSVSNFACDLSLADAGW